MAAIPRLAAALGAGWLALTAMSAPGGLEAGVLDRINFARAHPQAYADQLREYRAWFDGRILYRPGDEAGVVTREGPGAVDEAIDFLERQAPLPPLSEGEVLALAARDHAAMQGRDGGTGHVSPDGASPGERVRRRGGDIYVGESISYGFDGADDVVMQLIVDDGVPGRGHRKSLFARDYRYAGVGCGEHRTYRFMCVVDLSGTPTGMPMLPAGYRVGGGS
ncbi:MAG: CAP domain-containing protein [Pseudomonadota bacterium]